MLLHYIKPKLFTVITKIEIMVETVHLMYFVSSSEKKTVMFSLFYQPHKAIDSL